MAVFNLVILLFAALVMGHEGMLDNALVRDVGIVFTESKFAGTSHYVYEFKSDANCEKLGMNVASVQVCKADTNCVFYTGNDCEAGPDNYAVAMSHGDNAHVNTAEGNYFGSYICRCDGQLSKAVNETLLMESHNTDLD